MGLRAWLRGDRFLEGAYDEQRALPPPQNQYPLTPAFVASTHTTVTPLQALAIADVWSAVRCLADAASSLPLCVYRKTPSGRQEVTSGRLADLLDYPAPATTQSDMVSTLMAHVLIWGNAYLGKFGDSGDITQLAPIYPERINAELRDGQIRWRYTPPSGPQQLLTDRDIVHVKGLSVDGVMGLSPVVQAAHVLGLSDSLVKHALAYFDDGTMGMGNAGGTPRPAGVLRLGPDASGESAQIEKENLRNVSRPHGILVIRGDAEYVPISSKLDDSQFVEQRRLAAQEIARVFRIPPHMLGAPAADSMTYSTIEQQSIDFVRFSLHPWLRRIELAISNDPDLTFRQQYVKFEIDELLRGDAASRAAFYTAALDPVHGWMTRDEVRELEDLEPEDEPTVTQAMAAAVNQAIAPMTPTPPIGVSSNGSQG